MLAVIAGWGLGLLSSRLWQVIRDEPGPRKVETPRHSSPSAPACTDNPTEGLKSSRDEPDTTSTGELQVVARRSSSTTMSPSPQKRLVRAISLHLSPQKSRLQPLLSGAFDLDDEQPWPLEMDETIIDEPVRCLGRWDAVIPTQRLGRGASGSVYKASWNGAPIAVKYIPCRAGDEVALKAAVRELVLAKHFAHPHVVQCFDWAVLTSRGSEAASDVLPGAEEQVGALPVGDSLWPSHHHLTRGMEFENGVPAEQLRGTDGKAGPSPLKESRESAGMSAPASPSIPAFRGPDELEEGTPWPAAPNRVLASTSLPGSQAGTEKANESHETATSPADSAESEAGFGSPVKRKLSFRTSSSNRLGFELEDLGLGPDDAVLAVLMEHCDLGSLARALRRRAYIPSERWEPHLTQRALLRTAQEIAKGMAYIHEHGVVHGDLKPANVLLTTHRSDRRGYVAKIADFGLARSAMATMTRPNVASLESTEEEIPGPLHRALEGSTIPGIGTVAYSAPELIAGSPPTPASDVYAFGIILWEMVHCRPIYTGLGEHAVLVGVLQGNMRPEFDPGCVPTLERLANECWSHEPSARPSFQEVLERLVAAEMELRAEHLRDAMPAGAGDSPRQAAPKRSLAPAFHLSCAT